MKKEDSQVIKRIEYLMFKQEMDADDVIKIIREGTSGEFRRAYGITTERLRSIFKGNSPTVLESCIITQAIGSKLEDLYYKV